MSDWRSYADKPQPGTKFVVAHTDGCSSGIYVMLDDGPHYAEDGGVYDLDGSALWCALPADYPIRFMEVTEDDWR